MDKQYLINQLKAFADSYHISIDEDTLGDIISKSSFRVVSKGEILSSIGDDKTIAGMNASLVVDVPLMWFVMLLLSVPAICKGKLYRFQGIILLTIYFAYVLFQFFL